MVEDEIHQKINNEVLNPDRPRGVLSRADRKYLLNESDIESGSQTERDTRQRIRDRIQNSILDFVIIDYFLEDRDLELIFGRGRPIDEDQTWTVEGIHGILSFLYRGAQKEEQTLENWIHGGLKHTAYREAGIHGDVKKPPTVQLEITPPTTVNPQEVSEKIEQRRFNELDVAEIEFLLTVLGPLLDYSGDIDEAGGSDELRRIRESLEKYYTDMETGGPPDHIKTIQEHAEYYTEPSDQ